MGLKGPTGGGPTSAQSHVGLTMPGLGALPAQYPAPDLLNAAKFEVRFAFTSRSHCAGRPVHELRQGLDSAMLQTPQSALVFFLIPSPAWGTC